MLTLRWVRRWRQSSVEEPVAVAIDQAGRPQRRRALEQLSALARGRVLDDPRDQELRSATRGELACLSLELFVGCLDYSR